MLQNVMEGIACIEGAIQPMEEKLAENNIDVLLVTVKESMHKVVNSYEKGKEVNLVNHISQEVLPAFITWKKEIEKILKPYIAS